MPTILIVDDLAADRDPLATLLRSQGHRVLEAADGAEALALVQAEHPDLVISDMLMPVVDGYQLVRRLRLDPTTAAIPVVIYTASYGVREARALALSNTVSTFLTKPAEPQDVLRVVARLLAPGSDTDAAPGASPRTNDDDGEHLRLLGDALDEKSEDLRFANARLRALINIGLELASERDPGRLLHHVCEAVRDLFGATYVTLGILDLHDRTVQRVVTCGANPADWIKAGDTISGLLNTVVAERRSMRGDNPGGDPVRLQLPAVHPKIEAFVAAPVASPAHVYGWMCLVANRGRTFTMEDEDLVRALSGQIGRIYENGYFHEVAEKRADALRVAEERMRFALEAAGVGIWDMDYTSGVLRWSELMEAQYGVQPGTFGGTFDAFVERIHPDDRESVLDSFGAAMHSGADFPLQHRSIWPDGTVRWLSGAGRIRLGENGEPLRGLGISMDVTARRALELQYQQAQKMEAIGRLAGGVAHDFNNLLTAILGRCGLLLADLPTGHPSRPDIREIQQAGVSAAGMTHQLLAFTRKQVIDPTVLDLNVVVVDMRTMVERLIGEDVKVVLDLHPQLASVVADRAQVEQIVLNLAVNARDAMPKGGTLTIATANVELDEAYAATHSPVAPGPYVALAIADTGTGMTPQVQARLFEPFFTTKDVGKGTGLGLSTVHGIVTRNFGSVDVATDLGRGTRLTVYFPRAERVEAPVATPFEPPRPPTGTQSLLVVDDVAGLRDVIVRMLRRQGYQVVGAANAEDAMALFDQHTAISVLLTDVVMPGASGPELARRLIARRPGLRVIYMSGYTEDILGGQDILEPGIVFLRKPFTAEALGHKVREVLGL